MNASAPENRPSSRWLARLKRDDGPIYLGLVRALEAAIRAGDLQPGDRLPPQRTVAELLGIDFTTVTRAYSAARGRGLIEGAVGYAAARGAPAVESYPVDAAAGRIDLTQAFVGTRAMFSQAGFEVVGETAAMASKLPRLVMRRTT